MHRPHLLESFAKAWDMDEWIFLCMTSVNNPALVFCCAQSQASVDSGLTNKHSHAAVSYVHADIQGHAAEPTIISREGAQASGAAACCHTKKCAALARQTT